MDRRERCQMEDFSDASLRKLAPPRQNLAFARFALGSGMKLPVAGCPLWRRLFGRPVIRPNSSSSVQRSKRRTKRDDDAACLLWSFPCGWPSSCDLASHLIFIEGKNPLFNVNISFYYNKNYTTTNHLCIRMILNLVLMLDKKPPLIEGTDWAKATKDWLETSMQSTM